MWIRKAALAGVLIFYGLPALAQDGANGYVSNPKPIAAFALQNRQIELTAVTRRARADTGFRQEYMKERIVMGKVMPGYPQPPIVSFDVRVQF